MKKTIITTILAVLALTAMAQRKTDALDRGLVALPNKSGIFLSWRILPEEYYNVTYNVYRNGTKLNETPLTVSNFTDTGGSTSSTYTVKAVKRSVEQAACAAVSPWTEKDSQGNYFTSIPVADVYDRNGTLVYCACGSHTVSESNAQEYTINDISVGDVDGDGKIDFILKRINNTDRSDLFPTTNTTAFCRIEVYASSKNYGLLWWIDCGPNTVYGSDEQWDAVAFDWDQDGRCEVLYRAYGNTVIHKANGSTQTIGSSTENIRQYVSHVSNFTFTNCGTEWLVYINGLTGEPYVTMEYPLKRLETSEFSTSIDWGTPNSTAVNSYLAAVKTAWGDNYGHRSSKYFMGAPYLDGRTPSIYLGRGIYTRHKMIALDVNPSTHALTTRWTWACSDSSSPWYGNGYHNFSIADVDEDGRDEIVYGSMVIDDNGKGLHTTGFLHGDALHVGDFDPFRKGLEIFACLEDYPYWGNNYRNATTGEVYNKLTSVTETNTGKEGDDGRCMAGNFSNKFPGCLARSVNSPGLLSTVTDDYISGGPATAGTGDALYWSHLNFRTYWDGDLLDDILDSPGTEGAPAVYSPTYGRLFTADGCRMSNSSKNNAGVSGDILGDWREEIVVRASDNNSFRIYTTPVATTYRIPSLWFDHQYRQGMVWQSEGYNQPTRPSYFLGEMEGFTVAPPPLTNTGRTELSANGVITSAHNDAHVMFCGGGSIGVAAEGASPEVLTINVPSTVSGSGSNTLGAGITYQYSQCQLGATINSTNYKGDLTGSMRLVKQGDGLLKLTARSFSYSGNTDVWAGTLYFRGTLQNSALWMNRHTSLYTAGTYKRKVTMEYGSTLNLNYNNSDGTTEYSTANIDTLELHEGARVVFDIDQNGNRSDQLNIKRLILRTQDWDYGPEYLAPVLQVNSTAALAKGSYAIGSLNRVNGSLDDIIVECTLAGSSLKKRLYTDEGTLYLQVYSASDNVQLETNPTTTVKMTHVNYDAATTAYGELAQAEAGYNKLSGGSVGFANTGWGVNYITYLLVDASMYKGDYEVNEMLLSLDVSGSTDNKRTTSWGIGYNSSAWSSSMTYNSADKTITTYGNQQTSKTTTSTSYTTLTWDITELFNADADGKLTLLVYETAPGGGYIQSPSVSVSYDKVYAEDEPPVVTPVVTDVTLTDGEPYTAQADVTYNSATYTRTFSADEAGTWTPLYVPFSFSVEDYADRFDIAEIFAFCPYLDTNGDGEVTAEDADLMIVNKKGSGSTRPNTPYLVRPKAAGSCVITAAGGCLYASANGMVRTATTKDVFSIYGTYQQIAATQANGFYYLADGSLSQAASGSYAISPFRWYMTVSSRTDSYGTGSEAAAKPAYAVYVIGEDLDEPTAVEVLRASEASGSQQSAGTYTIDGRSIGGKLPTGIYIKNNKKIVVR